MKKKLIQTTYNILKSEGIENTKIRRIANEIGCTSAVIYKHFDDLDHLLTFASIKFLQDYYQDFVEIANENANILDMNIKLWECFCGYAFENVHVFELIFWGKYKEQLGDIFFEYFQLFKEEMNDFDGLTASIFFNNDLKEREYIMLRRAAATGILSYKDSLVLSDLISCLFHGMLLEYKEKYREPDMVQEATQRFISILISIIEKYRIK